MTRKKCPDFCSFTDRTLKSDAHNVSLASVHRRSADTLPQSCRVSNKMHILPSLASVHRRKAETLPQSYWVSYKMNTLPSLASVHRRSADT